MDKLTIKETKTILNIKQIGSPGPKGDDGDRGLSATISIGTVNTVDYTQQATVENVGTENDAILNFNIPKGIPGESGADFSNIGNGLGIYKETINFIAKLRSLESINSIILLNYNETDESITFDINTRAFNNAVGETIAPIYETISYLQGLIETNTNDIETINNSINTINNSITQINSTITSLETNINNNTSSINTNTTSINSLNTSINNINTSINTINTSLSSINTRLTTAETNISNNTNAINSLNSKVLPVGGTAGQVLTKIDGTNYNVQWSTSSGGSSVFNFNNYTRIKRFFPFASGQNPALNLVIDGYSNASDNYTLAASNCINPNSITGKNYYYNYPKRSYKDTTATGTNSSGYCTGAIYFSAFNMLRWGDLHIKVGLRTVNDTNMAQFIGLTSSTALPTQIGNIYGNANGYFIGFSFNETDTLYNLVYTNSFYTYKIPLSSFSGNFTTSDIQARQVETPISFQISPFEDGTGFKASFYNHRTKASGTYNFLYSAINQTYMFSDTTLFSPLFVNFQKNGYSGVKDIFDLFVMQEMS